MTAGGNKDTPPDGLPSLLLERPWALDCQFAKRPCDCQSDKIQTNEGDALGSDQGEGAQSSTGVLVGLGGAFSSPSSTLGLVGCQGEPLPLCKPLT